MKILFANLGFPAVPLLSNYFFDWLACMSLHYQPATAQLPNRNLFVEGWRWICFHLLSAPQSAALSKNRALRNEFPEKSRVRRAGNNSAAAAAAAAAASSVVVAAVSVREMEKGGSVNVCVSEPVWKRVPMHCTERSRAVPPRGKLCVPVWFLCALLR